MASLSLDLTVLEAAHLTDLIEQFVDVVADARASNRPSADPAVARLAPDVYRDDPGAAAEFRRLTESDMLGRRTADAERVLITLKANDQRLSPETVDRAEAETRMHVSMDRATAGAWLRTLSALRLVLASRLGIESSDDHVDGDARFGVYDWLGYRLDGLVHALES